MAFDLERLDPPVLPVELAFLYMALSSTGIALGPRSGSQKNLLRGLLALIPGSRSIAQSRKGGALWLELVNELPRR